MALFSFSASVAAGAVFNPLEVAGSQWKYSRTPYDSIVELLHRSTLVGMLVTVTSGSDEVQQESPISGGGTAGILTGRLNVEPLTFKAKAGDLIQIRYRNTNAAANNVDGTIELTRVGGA
jgi:hypothetical protein